MVRPACPPTVLVVDRDERILQFLALAFGKAGLVVRPARRGEDAAQALRRGGLDLVLLDAHLPAPWDTAQLLRELRAVAPGLPAVVMSASMDPRTARALNAHCEVRFFPKPIPGVSAFARELRALAERADQRPPAG